MIKAETKVVHGEETLVTVVEGEGLEVYTELVAVMCEMLEGGFTPKSLTEAVDSAVCANEHRDEWKR